MVLVVDLGCSVSLTKASLETPPPLPPMDMLPFSFLALMLLSRLLTSYARVPIECRIWGGEDQYTVPPQCADPTRSSRRGW